MRESDLERPLGTLSIRFNDDKRVLSVSGQQVFNAVFGIGKANPLELRPPAMRTILPKLEGRKFPSLMNRPVLLMRE
jgi:hypothetical protein